MERLGGSLKSNRESGFLYQSSPFFTRFQIGDNDNVFAVDTDMYITAGAEISAQRQSNRMAVFSVIATMLLQFGQKTLILTGNDDETAGDIKSAFRKKLAFTYFSFERSSEHSLPYGEEDYNELLNLARDNDDIRSIFVYGSTEEIMQGKRLATELKVPLSIFVLKPDGDAMLSPYYIQKRDNRAYTMPSEPPAFVFFDLATPLTPHDMKQGAGYIAKALLTLAQTDELQDKDCRDALLSVIKDCLFTDFTKTTVANKQLLYLSLLKLSALKKTENGFLFTAADGLMETLGRFGIDGKEYAYTCSRLISEIYSDVLSQPELTLLKPPDILLRYSRRNALGIKPDKELYKTPKPTELFTLKLTERISNLLKSLSLFESCCLNEPIPLSTRQLKTALLAAADIYGEHSLLRELYLSGLLPE